MVPVKQDSMYNEEMEETKMEFQTLQKAMMEAMKARNKERKEQCANCLAVMAELKGKADGEVINQVVAKLCQ